MSSATDSLCTRDHGEAQWSFEENKAFEVALATHFSRPDRWERIAEHLPSKTPQDVERYYQQLEDDIGLIDSGKVPLPRYEHLAPPPPPTVSPFAAGAIGEPLGQPAPLPSKKNKKDVEATNPGDRRKGVPWTEEEHKLFLLGLAKFGKGDWRSIARNFVVSRTPTQVASHAQKYFIRLNSANKKDKRRASIHDITSASLDMDVPGGTGKGSEPPSRAGSAVPMSLDIPMPPRMVGVA